KLTVFVGAVHGMLTASMLFKIMHDTFGNVDFVGIDTDRYKYPIGQFWFWSQNAFRQRQGHFLNAALVLLRRQGWPPRNPDGKIHQAFANRPISRRDDLHG